MVSLYFMMTKTFINKFYRISFLILIGIIFLFPLKILANEKPVLITWQTQKQSVDSGKILLSLVVDSNGNNINALEGEITIKNQSLVFKNISDSNSLVSLWIKRPILNQGEKLSFSGIIPGGYVGKGIIFTFIIENKNFKSIDLINSFSLNNFSVLLNDGQGSKVKVSFLGLDKDNNLVEQIDSILVLNKVGWPEIFYPVITKNLDLGDNKNLLLFATQDKTSGIFHYQVYESSKKINILKFNKKLDWITSESPYELKDQSLNSYIYVKAVNQAGNGRIMLISPQFSINRLFRLWQFWGIIILVIAGNAYLFWRRFNKAHEKK